MSDFINDLSVFGFTLLASILLIAFVSILRLTDKDYRKKFSKDEKIKKLEKNLVEYNSELKNLLPKVDPLEKKHLEFKYDPKKDREIESELNNLKGRIQTLERFLKNDKEKLKKLRGKN